MSPGRLVRTLIGPALAIAAAVMWPAAPVLTQTVTYQVTFEGNWTTASTPGGVVSGAHFTTLVGGVHGSGVSFWEEGGLASPGVEYVAELGGTSTFRSEVEASSHTSAVILQGVSGGGTGTATFNIQVTRTHPLVTLLSMIGPSPDWFVGISGLSLLDSSDRWRNTYVVDLHPYDAGTEDGTEFSLSNPATVPQGVITSIGGTGKFSNVRMARLTFTNQTPVTDPVASFASSAGTAAEDAGTRNVSVNLSPAPSSAIALKYTVGGTATAGSDFSIANSGTVSVSPGATTANIPVAITDDNARESSETVVLTLTSGTGYTVGGANSHTLTITDNDDGQPPPLPTVSLAASPNPVDEGQPVTVTVRLSAALPNSVTIPLGLTAGTAEEGDFGSLASVAIAGGQTSGTGTIATVSDADEDDETFTVALGALPAEVTVGVPSSVVVTIRDDDGSPPPLPTVSLAASPNPVDEGQPVTVTVRLSAALPNSVAIPLGLTAGTAEEGDFGSLASVAIAGGQTSGTGTIATVSDDDEDDETFTVALGTLPAEVTAGAPSSVAVTIRDDDKGPPPNAPPTVSASCDPCEVARGGAVRLSASASDLDGDPLSYAWSAPRGRFVGSVNDANARWIAPNEAGGVTIRVRVSDGRGGSGSDVVRVTVVNRAPRFGERVYRFDLPENVDGREHPLRLGRVMASDPDGDSVTYELVSGDRDRFRVGAREGDLIFVGPPEDFEVEPNRYDLTVRARDGAGAEDEAQVEVTVVDANDAPVAADDEAETREDEAVTVEVLANDRDADGDELRVAAVTQPSHGAVAIGSAGAVSYAPEPNWHGTDRFRYVVADGGGLADTAEVAVRVLSVNDAPVAAGDEAETREDEAVTVEVLANDRDPDGDELRVAAVTQPSHGTVEVGSAGAVSYAPEPDWHGTDRFRYVVADGGGLVDTAEVAVRVVSVNDAPVAADDEAETREDEAVTVEVLANDRDADGDELRVAAVTQPSHGTVAIGSAGAVSYAPEPDWHGTDRFRYVVADGGGLADTAEVAVKVLSVNDAPVAAGDEAETREDEAVTVEVLANDRDPDGDELRVASVTQPSHGTVAIGSAGAVSYAPEPDWHGTDRFGYVVADGGGLADTAEVVVRVLSVNDAPVVIRAIPDQMLDEGGGAVEIDLTPFFGDPDGDALTYSAGTSDRNIVAVVVSGELLTIVPIAYGTASVTVTTEDSQGLNAGQTFSVGVDDQPVRAILNHTLAAMARSHLASARQTLGRRAVGGAPGDSRLTMMGQPIPLDRQSAGQMLTGCVASAVRSPADDGMSPSPGAMAGLSFGGCVNLQGATEFQLALGADDGTGPRWSVWGQGDIQTFRGSPGALGQDASYDGDLRTSYAGIDTRLADRWLAGLAVSRGRGAGDWGTGSAKGRLTTSLTALHPYLRWSDGTTSVWTMAGAGRGSAENLRDATGASGSSNLQSRLGLVEVRRRIAGTEGGAEFGLRADAAWAELRTDDGSESIDGHAASVDQQRIGLEVSRHVELGRLRVAPYGETHLRRDGGAGQPGRGIELAGGLRGAIGVFGINAQGRILAVHSADDYRERGAAVTLSLGRQSSEGLSLSVSSRWGDGPTATGALWEDDAYLRRGPLAGEGAWTTDARGSYGMRVRDALLTWSGALSHSDRGSRLTMSGRLGGRARPQP